MQITELLFGFCRQFLYCSHNAVGEGVFCGKCSQRRQRVVAGADFLDGLVSVKGDKFRHSVADVYYQFHAAKLQ